MNELIGFIINPAVIDNNNDSDSSIGELSTYSRTFSQDIKEYKLESGLTLVVFDHLSGGIPHEVHSSALTIVDNVFGSVAEEIAVRAAPYDRTGLAIAASSTLSISNLYIDDIITNNSGDVGPEYMTFYYMDHEGQDTHATIYYSDIRFSVHYPKTDLKIVHPVNDISLLHDTYDNLLLTKSSIDPVTQHASVQDIIGDDPATSIELLPVDIHPSDDFSKVVTFYWTIISYGPHGNDIRLQKEAVKNALRTDDALNISVWAEYRAVELFEDKEFRLFPLWNNFAIADMETVEGMYSPIGTINDIVQYIKDNSTFTEEYIMANLELTVFDYKSIMVAVIPLETDNTERLIDVHPDYILTPSNNEMLQRVSPKTSNWMRYIIDLLAVSEGKYEIENVSADVRSLTIDDHEYYTMSFDGIAYTVLARTGGNL